MIDSRKKLATLSFQIKSIFSGHPIAIAGLIGFIVFVLTALLAPWIAPQNPYDLRVLDIMDGLLPPLSTLGNGTFSWLGTDAIGRDILSAVMYGLRLSLFVAFVAVSIGTTIGVFLGLLAATKGGWVESVIMRAVDLKVSFPGILLALMLLAVFGTGVDKIIYALIIGVWASKARLTRSSALSEMQKEYIDAAKISGIPNWRIMLRFLLPNSIAPVLVMVPMALSGAIGAEATLSFLGVGVPITEPSLGLLIANGNDYLLSGKWWISIFPGVVLVSLVLCINVVADRIREHNNPYLKSMDKQ
jgi:peptide/nickel transport system permease protein